MKLRWLCVSIIVALLVIAGVVRADSGPSPVMDAVSYAELTDELIFRHADEGSRMLLYVRVPWRGTETRLYPQRAGNVWVAHLDVSQMPPMTEIEYSWVIGTSATTAWASTSRPAPGFREWHYSEGQHVDVFGSTGARDLDAIAAAADAGYDRARAILGDAARDVTARPRVVVFASQRDYAAITGEWGEGVAYPRWGVTMQYRGPSALEDFTSGVIPHELLHLLDPTAGDRGVPPWFYEGLAVMNEGEFSHARLSEVMRQARRERTLFHPWRMMQHPCAETSVVWYAQAWDMVERLGADNAQAIITEMERGYGFIPAWRRVMDEKTPEDWIWEYLYWRMRFGMPRILIGIAVGCVLLLIYREYLLWKERRGGAE